MSVVELKIEGDIAWITVNNPPVNATSTAVRQGLLDAITGAQRAKLAVLQCAGKTFIAGGDMSEFDRPAEEPHLPDVVQSYEDSKTPVLALLHGNVLGGGFEIAMACAWRFAAPGTRFGLPEVNVGLIPGAGGTQRLPRLIGMGSAIDVACFGKMLSAEDLLSLGGLDRIVSGDLQSAAEAFVQDLPERPVPVSQRNVSEFDDALIGETQTALTRRAKGQNSPLENLAALQWSMLPFTEGQPKERARHLELRNSAESRALRHAFFAERAVAKPAIIKDVMPREVDTIAVVGGGLMGAGIATAALSSGLSVTLIERDEGSAAAARDRVCGLLESAVKRGKMTEAALSECVGRFNAVADFAEAAGAQLAIEAVFEDAGVKQEVFQKLSAVMKPNAILATNTSYLDPMLIFDGISHPERCIGLHFFSPAHVMKLLEIVKTPLTSPEVIATGFALGKRLRKVSVLSGICDGFIGNRMLAAYRREAEYLLADGALPYQVDAAMRAFGMPMGPYELQDLTGLQIAWANRKRQAAARDPAERYETISDQLCEMGRLGQRSGKGWYSYAEGSRIPERDQKVEHLIESYTTNPRREYSQSDITDRILAVLINEGSLIVEEGIADTTEAVDLVQIHGYGFPRWRGGPMQYAAEVGWDQIAKTMKQVADESPNSWRISARLMNA